jgi:hypothetical protein
MTTALNVLNRRYEISAKYTPFLAIGFFAFMCVALVIAGWTAYIGAQSLSYYIGMHWTVWLAILFVAFLEVTTNGNVFSLTPPLVKRVIFIAMAPVVLMYVHTMQMWQFWPLVAWYVCTLSVKGYRWYQKRALATIAM